MNWKFNLFGYTTVFITAWPRKWMLFFERNHSYWTIIAGPVVILSIRDPFIPELVTAWKQLLNLK